MFQAAVTRSKFRILAINILRASNTTVHLYFALEKKITFSTETFSAFIRIFQNEFVM